MYDPHQVWESFWNFLYSEAREDEEYWSVKPLLAHYTSVQNFEKILVGNEVWLSNPLFMNDLEEVRFGVNSGFEIIMRSNALRDALKTDRRREIFFGMMREKYDLYAGEKVIDLYVMCFSEHEQSDTDGRLSMWRGYGSNGGGVAIVFDTSKIAVVDDSPLALLKVRYGTTAQRIEWIEQKILALADYFTKNMIPDELLPDIVDSLFDRIALFAVATKHAGFMEEQEWRLVYLQDRDPEKKLQKMFGYFNGTRGIEPKLKLKLSAMPGVTPESLSLPDLIHSVILGPTASTPLAALSMQRMFHTLGIPELKDKLIASTIPFRGS